MAILLVLSADARDPEWDNPQIIGRDKGPAHCWLMPYANTGQAMTGARTASPYYQCLNGKWRFNWLKSPDERSIDFHRPAYDVSGWDEIEVPSNWQLSGMVRRSTRTSDTRFAKIRRA